MLAVLRHCNFPTQIIINRMHSEFTESADLTITNSGLRQRITQRLTQAWREQRVEAYFQGIFLESLREASISQFSEMAAAEIELTASRQSFAFSIQLAAQGRADTMRRVRDGVDELQGKASKTERDIEQVCRCLQEVRQANLHFVELLLDLDRYFRESLRQDCYSGALARELRKLDESNHFLRESVLRKFILFSNSYDPFFLNHQQALSATQNPRLKEIKSVQALFTLPISFVYRLGKAQRGALEYLSRETAPGKEKPNKFRIISPVRDSVRTGKKGKYFSSPKDEPMEELEMTSAKMDEQLSSFRLDKDAYLSNRKNTEVFSNYFQPARKGSDDTPLPPSPPSRVRNISVRSVKEPQILPRLNTIHSISNQKDSKIGSSSFTKRYNAHRSINEMEEREEELRKLVLPKKFEHLEAHNLDSPPKKTVQLNRYPTLDSPPKKIVQLNRYPTLDIRREVSVQCDPPMAVGSTSISSPNKGETQTIEEKPMKQTPGRSQPPPSPPPQVLQEQASRKKFKKYQLKALKIPLKKFMQSFRELTFNNSYGRIFETGSWQNSITHNQYYFHKLFVNDQLSAISLSCALPQGDILIKCWGPLSGCDSEMSHFLFGKYVQHIEKSTFCNTIFYNNLPIDQLQEHGFVRQKERIYERSRVYPSLCDKGEYSPFLALNFTCVAINKQTAKQEELLLRQGVEDYHPLKFICFNYLLIINKLMQSGSFSTVAAYRPRLSSIKQSNTSILSQFLSPEAYSPSFRCSYVHLLTLRLRNPIKYAFFLADQGYIKLFGELVDEREDSVIVALPFLRYNTRMFFGKGFKTATEMAERCRAASMRKDTPQRVSFSVRMFRKKLRGRMAGVNLKQENTYGDFEVNFCWRDFLKGKIEHDVTQSQEIFDSTFYCLLEMERELLFVFEVTSPDFVFSPE